MNKELLSKVSILYVEDQEDIKTFTSEILGSFVKNLYVAQNGLEGIEQFKKHKNEIDIIITDISMPKLDGLSMVKEIHKIDENITTIITTAYTDQEFFQESINLGITSYTLKPIDLYDLVNNIIKSLEIKFLKENILNENLLLNNEEKFSELIEKQDNAIIILDKEEKILKSNENFKNTFNENFSLDMLIEDNGYFSLSKVPSNKTWHEYLETLKEMDKVVKVENENKIKLFKIDIIKLEDETILLSFFDITKLSEKSNLLEYKSHHDNLTGLYNQNKFHKLYSVESKRARRYRKDLSFILFEISDIFDMKESLQEKIILNSCECINSNIREHDVNFKWDNNSFLVLTPETDLDGAINVAYKLEENLKELLEENSFKNKIFFGVTTLDNNDNEKLVISRLEKAVKTSKESKDSYVNYL